MGEMAEEARSGEYTFAFEAPLVPLEMVAWKKDASFKDALPRLVRAKELLRNADFSSPESIKSALWAYAEEVGKGELLWPLRVTLSGRERSPDPFMCAFILGREETLDRITHVCDKIGE